MTQRVAIAALALLVAGCAGRTPAPVEPARDLSAEDLMLLNRVTWGANASSAREMAATSTQRWLERQLRPSPVDDLPPEAKAQVAAMTITQKPMRELAADDAARRREFRRMSDPEKAKEAKQALQQELTKLAREAMTRAMLRAVYSPWQLREQMTWFWMNHFSVFAAKAEIRVYLADYEEKAIRPRALGRFRDLLEASARHPAMMRYLDNAQNRAGYLNENYARELMELHTLGVDGGYTQKDVQELARVLTGFGLFAFSHAWHDDAPKTLLGEPIRARGERELDEALDRLARHPSTARFVSRKLAVFFVDDEPPPALVERMAAEWARTDGEIGKVLQVVFVSPEFKESLGKKFKDPVHYVYSAVRIAHDGRPMPETVRMLGWLGRLGEPLYLRQTPDGYPLAKSDWSSAGQMAVRFEVARAIGYSAPADMATATPGALPVAFGEATRAMLEKANSNREKNFLLLASPEFMLR
jgi:uncharacterized protein (DUF1800 family)